MYMNLGEMCQNKILRNIFSIEDVSISMIVVRENNIIFRMFGSNVFYQYIFSFQRFSSNTKVLVTSTQRMVSCLVDISYPFDFNLFDFDPFDLFLKLLCCRDEYQVYQILRLFL